MTPMRLSLSVAATLAAFAFSATPAQAQTIWESAGPIQNMAVGGLTLGGNNNFWPSYTFELTEETNVTGIGGLRRVVQRERPVLPRARRGLWTECMRGDVRPQWI